MGRYEGAAEAVRRAGAWRPEDPNVAAMFGESVVMASGGTVTQAAETALKAAAKANPGDTRTQYYLALAELQKGNAETALNQWAAMVEAAPADAPWLEVVRRQMAAAEEQLGREPGTTFAEVKPEAPAGTDGASGPTREQMQAAQDMSPEQRREMIAGMVEGLAARLEQNPRDFQGWQRLIRSYGVLGETEKAEEALRSALETFQNAPFVRQQLIAQAREQNLSLPEGVSNGATGDTSGPSQEQMEAAQDMSPEQRREMIAGMVDGLAKRLEEQPDDLEGWLMLGRSYRVLEEPAKARDALAKAAELAPDNVEVLSRYARAIRAAAGERQTDESYEVTQRILELDVDNPQALWFTALRHAANGDRATAREMFDRALAQLPQDTPQTAELRRRAEQMLAE
jgi:cytochrome c-type biogenesis protein CcmH